VYSEHGSTTEAVKRIKRGKKRAFLYENSAISGKKSAKNAVAQQKWGGGKGVFDPVRAEIVPQVPSF
jgi:glutamate dehydrogenase/leucine dehydrogenase